MSENKESHIKRKSFWVDKHFQGGFILRFSGVILLTLLVTLGLLWGLNKYQYELLPDGNSVLTHIDLEINDQVQLKKADNGNYVESSSGDLYIKLQKKPAIYNALSLYWRPIVFFAVVNIFVMIVFSIFFSHKMAGPVHRIKQILQHYIDGHPVHKIRLRKDDQLDELVLLLNKALKLQETKDHEKK